RGLRQGTILRHSIRRFACKSSFSETTSHDQPLTSDHPEVAQQLARGLPAGEACGRKASRIAAGWARRRVGRAADSGWIPDGGAGHVIGIGIAIGIAGGVALALLAVSVFG